MVLRIGLMSPDLVCKYTEKNAFKVYYCVIQEPRSGFPVIIWNSPDEVSVVVDGCTISVEDTNTALAVLVAAYWVLNIQFPKQLRNTLSFIASYVMGLAVDLPCPVVRVMNYLKK